MAICSTTYRSPGVLPGMPLPLSRSLRPCAEPAGTRQLHAAVGQRHVDAGAERGLPRRDRQVQIDIAAVDAVQRVRPEGDLQVQVARRRAVEAGCALPGQAQVLAFAHARGMATSSVRSLSTTWPCASSVGTCSRMPRLAPR